MDSALPTTTPRDQTDAILKLLADEDASVVELVMEQLRLNPSESKAGLEQLLDIAKGRAKTVIRAELERLAIGDPAAALKASCHRLKTPQEYEEFCWAMCLYHNQRAPLFESKKILDEWGDRVRRELVEGAGPHEQLAALRLVLVSEERLAGNEKNYYDPENCFLDRVIATRLGLPISLSAIYILVGMRAGIHVEPVGMPGHFLARIGSCFFTPFNRGNSVERSSLEETLTESGFNMDFAVLDQTPIPLVAQRMVNNLVSIYTQTDDTTNLIRWQGVLNWLQENSF